MPKYREKCVSFLPTKGIIILFAGKPSSLFDKENTDWAPNQKLGHNSLKKTNQERAERYSSIQEKRRRRESAQALAQLQFCNEEEQIIDNDRATATKVREISTQTDLTLEQLNSIEVEINHLREEKRKVKKELQEISLDKQAFEKNDKKVLFYTGLPSWQLLFSLFNYILPFLSHSTTCVLSPFQRLLLTLMRLRLDLGGQDLAYRFGNIHATTVSKVFLQVIDILQIRLSPLIYWPSREQLLKTMPLDFRKNCPGCVVIIDCFEIFLERASNPLARAQTYSSYKHHNTVKYLIGITPQGTVSFISDGWGGRVSDKHLTEESGILDKLIPGDVILADRGFDIQESVGLYCARIKIPAFTKGKKQLSGIEVEQTRRIANVRIHVERVIGNVRKKYSILSATQPIDFVKARDDDKTILDKIVSVSCALTNMCDSVVPFE